MRFDVSVRDPRNLGPTFEATVSCPRCRQATSARLRNVAWNALACERCRFARSQFVSACRSTIGERDGRLGYAEVEPYWIDWRRFDLWATCVGSGEERRVPVAFQLVADLPTAIELSFECVGSRIDDGREVFRWSAPWMPCPCANERCSHDRRIRWLPPTDVWDQSELWCEVRLTHADDVLFTARQRLDVSPPAFVECAES